MILVVSPNLAVDLTLEVETLSRGAVHRARRSKRQAGGKGVNVARALRSLGPLGEEPLVLGFAGGRAGDEIAAGLAAEELPSELLSFSGESRLCTIVLETDGMATVINEAGPSIGDASGLLARFEALVGSARAVALMGSLPPELPPDTFAAMIDLSRESGRPSLLDSSGEALALGLAAGPSLAKPNRREAEALLGRKLSRESSRREGAAALRFLGAEAGLVSFGAEGFLLSTGDGLARFTTPVPSGLRLGNPTGAGDSLAAGYLAGMVRGYSPLECARLGAAAAAASLAEGYGRFRPKDVRVEAVVVEELGEAG